MKASSYKAWLYSDIAQNLANKMNVTLRTIYKWRSGDAPTKLKIKQITKLTHGKVQYEDVIHFHLEKLAK